MGLLGWWPYSALGNVVPCLPMRSKMRRYKHRDLLLFKMCRHIGGTLRYCDLHARGIDLLKFDLMAQDNGEGGIWIHVELPDLGDGPGSMPLELEIHLEELIFSAAVDAKELWKQVFELRITHLVSSACAQGT